MSIPAEETTPNPTLASILTEGMTPENVGAYQLVANQLQVLAEQDKGRLSSGIYRELHAGAVFDLINSISEDKDGQQIWKANDLGVTEENYEEVKQLLMKVKESIAKNSISIPIKEVRQAVSIANIQAVLNSPNPKEQYIALKIALQIQNMNGINQTTMTEEAQATALDSLMASEISRKSTTEEKFNEIRQKILDCLPVKEKINNIAFKSAIDRIAEKINYKENFTQLIADYDEDQKTIAQQVLGTIQDKLQDGETLTVSARPNLGQGKGVATQTIIESLRDEYRDQSDKLAVLEDIVRTLPPEGIKSDGISKAVIQQTSDKLRVSETALDAAIVSSEDERETVVGQPSILPPTPTPTEKDTAVVEPESVSGDKSIDMWRPDPSEFLAKCGLGKNKASIGPATPTPEASPEEKLKQAAMWYYTSAASCFNDKGFPLKKAYEENFENFQNYANDVFVNQFGLTQNDANNLFSWSGASAPGVSEPKQDTVSLVKDDRNVDVNPEAMTKIKKEVRAELMSIPGVVTRKTGTFHTEDTNLMPRVVDARMMETFMKPSGLRGAVIGARWGGGKPGSLEGNKFTVAPGRGRANELFGTMSWHKGKGTGKTLVQAAVAMGLFNKTGSKVKFNLTGSPQELQNKFSAILDEMERYDLPLDKCTFSLPNDVMCPDIASLKKALLDTSHPLSRASNYGSGSQNVRNKLLMRIQSMENKIKNRSPSTEALNVNMAHCTQAAILTRAIPEGMTARQQEVFAQDLKNMNPETQKQVIQEAAANLAQNGSEDKKNQRFDVLLGVATAAVTDSNTARKLMGPDITGSMVAYESYAQNVTTIREIVAASPLEANLDNAEKGLMERAGIENMDPNRGVNFMQIMERRQEGGLFKYSRDMRPTKTYVDAATLQTTQERGQEYIQNLDNAATQLQEEIQKLKENISQTLEDPAKTSLLKSQLNDKEMDLITLQGSQKQALDSVTRSVQPLEYLSPREGSGFSVEEKIAALQAASKSNRKLVEEGGLKLPGLKSDLAKIKEDIAKVSTVDWMMGNTNYQVLQNKQAIIEKKIDLYENASINLENIQLCVKAAATPDGDEKNHLQEAIQEYAGNQKVRTHSDKPDTTYQPEIEIKVENPAKEDENKEIVITQYDKNKNPDDPDYRVEKRIPLDEENKPTSGETLEQAFHQAITSGNNAAITNSPGLWEAVQRIAVDSDKKNSQDLGGIKIYSQDFLEATDGLPTLAEAGKNQGTTNEHNAKLQAWQKVFAIPRTTTFSWSKNPIQKNTLGVESRTTRTTLATQEIEAAKETMNIKAQALKERASSIMQGPSQEVARSSLSSSATAYSNYSKPQPTSSK